MIFKDKRGIWSFLTRNGAGHCAALPFNRRIGLLPPLPLCHPGRILLQCGRWYYDVNSFLLNDRGGVCFTYFKVGYLVRVVDKCNFTSGLKNARQLPIHKMTKLPYDPSEN